jgi:serine/threonine protein kinase
MQFAHGEGMVHCDIKPGNIMIHRNGTVLVADFGIARMTDAATTTMVGMGTPAYMAPEQIGGLDPTQGTDIYALGIVLYEMLTGGERPFTGEHAQTTGSTSEKVRWEHIHLEAPSPRLYNPDISIEMEAVVLKCLEKNPDQRYASAIELWKALERAATGLDETYVVPIPSEPKDQALDSLASTLDVYPETSGKPINVSIIQNLPKWLILIASVTSLIVVCVLTYGVGSRIVNNFIKPNTPVVGQVEGVGLTNSEATEASNDQARNESSIKDEGEQTPTGETRITTPAEKMPTGTRRPTDTRSSPNTLTPNVTDTPIPTKTPEIYYPLSGCVPSRLHIGDSAFVSLGGGRNAIREEPDTHPTDNIIGYAEEGQVLVIVDGPECNFGWILWEVRTDHGEQGWTPESDGEEFWLVPFEIETVCTGAPPTRLRVGDNAYVGHDPPVANKVRQKAGLSYDKSGTILPGEKIEITKGPECSDNLVWWKIHSLKTGLEGWTSEGNSASYWLVPIP